MASIQLFQELLNLKSKLSHVQQSSIDSIFSTPISHTCIASQIYDEVFDLTKAIEDIHRQMEEELVTITELQDQRRRTMSIQQDEIDSCPLEPSLIQKLLKQAKDETRLELSILDYLQSNYHSDHDQAITFMACLEYPPYLNKNDMKSLIELNMTASNKETENYR